MNIIPLVDEKDILLKTKLDFFDFNKNDAQKLSKDLIDNMMHYGGVGLAANQIGINARVFSMIHENNPIVIFNPQLVSVSDEKIRIEEGCLSFKGLYPKVLRPAGVSLKYYDEKNQLMFANFINFSARIVLHEYDHLNGYTFHDRASRFDLSNARKKQKIILRKLNKGKNGSKNS